MPDDVSHPTTHELTAFGLGKLPERAAAAVAAHLESCPACRKAVANVSPDSFLGKLRDAGPDGPAFPPGSAKPSNAGSPPPLVPCPDLPPALARHSKYHILRELGRGGMGVVYQARQTVMNRPVVIKVINRSLLDRADSLERFHREVRAAAMLSHPNIVTAYDAEQIGDSHMLVMEFVPGQSLAEMMQKKGPLPIAHACHFMRQVALGLQHAHERKMVHRDIKPQNLMLSLKNQVKILDFGLAKMVRERDTQQGLTPSDTCMGTAEFMAPEQAQNAAKADIRADLYSLGCTLYCLLAGRPPFREDTFMNTVLAHIQKEPQPLSELRPDVPAELWQVVKRLLAKEPAKRYQKPIEVVQALAPFVKAGSKSGARAASAPVAGVSSPVKGTMISADTNKIKNVLREVPRKTPPKGVPAKTENVPRKVPGKTPKGVPAKEEKTSPFADLGVSASPPVAQGPKRKGRKGCVLTVAVSVSLALMLILRAGGLIPFRVQLDSLFRSSSEPKPGEPPTKSDKVENNANAQAPDPMEEWIREVAALPAEQQIERVKAKLKERNPDFKGWSDPPTIKNGVVTELVFVTDRVTDIHPLRALRGLKQLTCVGSSDHNGKLADLSPLKGMQLTSLQCYRNNPLSDLAPLKGMPLESLQCWGTAIWDLSPLKGMPLKHLYCSDSRVSDLSPLKNIPLKTLRCDFRPERDTAILRSIETLETINAEPAAQFWKEVDEPKRKASTPPTAGKPQVNIPADASMDDLRRALKSENPAVQEIAAARLADRGAEAAPAMHDLAEILTNAKALPIVRRNSALAIGHIGAKAKPVVSALAKAIKLTEPEEVRRSAAEALAQMKYPANEEAIPAILKAIENDNDSDVRVKCTYALFRMEQPEFKESGAEKLLIKVLGERTGGRKANVRYNAARKLAWLLRDQAPDKTADVLLELLSDTTRKVYNRTDVKVKDGRSKAEEEFGDDARYMAAQALSWLGRKAANRPDVKEALRKAAKDKDKRLKAAAKKAMEDLNIPE